jgi:hypothetical protein
MMLPIVHLLQAVEPILEWFIARHFVSALFLKGIGSMAEAIRILCFCCDNGASTAANKKSRQ